MSLTTEADEHSAQLSNALEAMASLTADGLVRRDQLGELSFGEHRELFAAVLELASLLRKTPLDDVSPDVLRQLSQSATDVNRQIGRIATFSATQGGDLASSRDQIVRQLTAEYNAFFRAAAPVIAFKRSLGIDVATFEKEAQDAVEKIQRNLEEEVEAIRGLKNDAEETVAAVRSAAAEAGIEHHAEVFDNEAKHHTKWSLAWLLITALIAASTVGFAWWNVKQYAVPDDIEQALLEVPLAVSIQLAVAKVLLFSVLYFALVGASRIYRAHRHNAVVNAHRRNALKTFQAFAKAAGGDLDIKNAVLLKSTETIFSPESTGYLPRAPEPQGSPQVLEIIRSALRTERDA